MDEALERLHAAGPEREGWLSNHAPMAVEALVRGGQAERVHRWIDRYRPKLEDMPAPYERVTELNWREALGDPRRIGDWSAYFAGRLAWEPWRDVLALWWPRLLPGITGGATHPVIRTGHAVRTLLEDEARSPGAAAGPGGGALDPRRAELGQALGYWAARSAPLPALSVLPPARDADGALAAVPGVERRSGGVRERLARVRGLPAWPERRPATPEEAAGRLRELVAAAVHRYAAHGHGEPVMLVHAATAPNAVLRTLPALPRRLWTASVDAAWSASGAVTAAYEVPGPGGAGAALLAEAFGLSARELFARAAAHGDEHAVKFADTALDVGGPRAGAAALRSLALIEPLG
ncbi:questin oxidase family protein [Streptomyces sp. NPDC007088]|uniref:questin oxidase family protein n=1 Tax=Streptomyces sp. NPDC007088 TaxID=3364773 RepID=UPI0036B9D97E